MPIWKENKIVKISDFLAPYFEVAINLRFGDNLM